MKLDDQTFWNNHIAELARSGLSRAAYCRKNGLSYSQFRDKQRRQGRAIAKRSPAFVRVAASSADSAPAAKRLPMARLVVGARSVIEFDPAIDPQVLCRMVWALEGGAQ